MNWSDIGGAIGKAAPILGGLVGGPAGAAVGAIVAAGLGVDNTPDAVSDALKNDPDALVKLKQIEADNKVQLQQLSVTAEQNRLLDVQSARARQTANPTDRTPQWLAAGITLGFFGCLAAVMLAPLRQDVHDLLLVMVGALQTAWIAVVSYYFGSSKDSREKTQMIADVGNAAASAPINVQPAAVTVQPRDNP